MSIKPNNIFFSQCLYKPIITNAEVISIGLLIHIPKKQEIKFIPSNSHARILNFDDELTKEELNLYLRYLTFEFSNSNLYNKFKSVDLSINSPAVINSLTKNQVNHIRFSSPSSFELEENDTYETAIEKLKKLYLYFDTPKNQRLNRNQLVSIVKRGFKSTLGEDLVKSAPKDNSPMDNPIPYDLKIMVNKKDYLDTIFIKVLKLDYAKSTSLVSELQKLIYKLDYSTENYSHRNLKIISNIKEEDLTPDILDPLNKLKDKGFIIQHLDDVTNDILNPTKIS